MASKNELDRTVPYQVSAIYYNGGRQYRDQGSLMSPGLREEIRLMRDKVARFWDTDEVPDIGEEESYLQFIRLWVPPENIGNKTMQLLWDVEPHPN